MEEGVVEVWPGDFRHKGEDRYHYHPCFRDDRCTPFNALAGCQTEHFNTTDVREAIRTQALRYQLKLAKPIINPVIPPLNSFSPKRLLGRLHNTEHM